MAEAGQVGSPQQQLAERVRADGRAPGRVAAGCVLVGGVHPAGDGIRDGNGTAHRSLIRTLPAGQPIREHRADAHSARPASLADPCQSAIGQPVGPGERTQLGYPDAEQPSRMAT